MVTLEERVAHLEGRAVEQSMTFEAIRDLHAGLLRQMDLLLARMNQLDACMDRLDARMDRLEVRMDGFDRKLDQRFAWLLGMQVTTVIAIVAALVAR